MSTDDLHILGIRHHGPGSARSVVLALDQIKPAAVLIEGPPELDKVIDFARSDQMRPPIAGLVYDVKSPRRASFYPMATFSPEWNALQWALRHDVPVNFVDLPAANRLAADNEEEVGEGETDGEGDEPTSGQSEGGLDEQTPPQPVPADGAPVPDEAPAHATLVDGAPVDEDPMDATSVDEAPVDGEGLEVDDDLRVSDPLAAMAAAAGYDDPERWWEDAVEQRDPDGDVLSRFQRIEQAMALYRRDLAIEDTTELRCREAAMRKEIRKALKASPGPVVMICGAYHAPALTAGNDFQAKLPTVKSDNELLRQLPSTRVAATWAPWTSPRLSYRSGYGAGVDAPRWYQHLFDAEPGQDVIAGWMVHTARLLRSQNYDASAASAVEATRLAEALAILRARPLAGLDEVLDASTTVFANGSRVTMAAVIDELLVGTDLGQVPTETPMVPLARDIEATQKSLRLKRSAAIKEVVIDQRKDSQLARSVFFWRLYILDLNWARPGPAGGGGNSTFKELWQLQWEPELEVAIIEASLYGTTVLSAAANKIVEQARDSTDLSTLAGYSELCLQADLPGAMTEVLAILTSRTAQQPDYLSMMNAVAPLARTARYGNVRGTDTDAVSDLINVLVTRLAVGLANACVSLDDEAALNMRRGIDGVQQAISILDDETLVGQWYEALAGLPQEAVHGTVMGRVARILFDSQRIEADEVQHRLSRALSLGANIDQAANWLDGFLQGDVSILLYDRTLLGLIDDWLMGLDPDAFDAIVPLIRRTFSRFQPPERQLIGQAISGQVRMGTGDHLGTLDTDQAAPVVAAVAELLGVTP